MSKENRESLDQSGVMFYSLSDDKATASIKVDAKNMTAPELNELIARLGIVRAHMTPEVPVGVDEKDAAPLPLLDRMYGRHFAAGQIPAVHGAVFVARSPMFGMQSFPASPEYCRGLAAWLIGDTWSERGTDVTTH